MDFTVPPTPSTRDIGEFIARRIEKSRAGLPVHDWSRGEPVVTARADIGVTDCMDPNNLVVAAGNRLFRISTVLIG